MLGDSDIDVDITGMLNNVDENQVEAQRLEAQRLEAQREAFRALASMHNCRF